MKMAAKMPATMSPGPHERQHDADEDAEASGTVDHGGVVELTRDLIEEADEDPDRQRQAERDVRDDRAPGTC